MSGIMLNVVGGTFTAAPGAPTIGTATAGYSNCASVTFTAPVDPGIPAVITGYRVISTPGCICATGASSPIVVSGLTNAVSYTFKAQATNGAGYGPLSAASNSITAVLVSSVAYTVPGTYSFIPPTGITAVTVLAIGAGGAGGGGGGGLGYKNSISVNPGCSYTVVVGLNCVGFGDATPSYFISAGTVRGGGGGVGGTAGSAGGTKTGDGGGNGGGGGRTLFSCGGGGGGGAGGYSGNGGTGGNGKSNGSPSFAATSGTAGSGGGGGGGGGGALLGPNTYGGGGGGVGIFGSGSSGTGGALGCGGARGGDGSGGTNDGTNKAGGFYGGGGASGGGGNTGTGCPVGSAGVVRILWNAAGRGVPAYPSTNVGA